MQGARKLIYIETNGKQIWKAEPQKLVRHACTKLLLVEPGIWTESNGDKLIWYVDNRPQLYKREDEGWIEYRQEGNNAMLHRGMYR